MKRLGYWLLLASCLVCVPVVYSESVGQDPYPAGNYKKPKLYQVLLFRWKPECSAADRFGLYALWNKLVKEISGFRRFGYQPLQEGEYQVAVTLVFESDSAYRVYLQHPDHLEIAKRAPRWIEKFSSYSYWKR